jgi:Asx homology domain
MIIYPFSKFSGSINLYIFRLKPGALGKVDSKFRHHLATWQSNLAAGEYDTEVRRKFIDMAVGNLDPWKMENFEPVYGQM